MHPTRATFAQLVAGIFMLVHASGAVAADQKLTSCVTGCQNTLGTCNDGCYSNCCFLVTFCKDSCLDSCLSRCFSNGLNCSQVCGSLAAGNVDTTARVSRDGRRVRVTGPIACNEGLEVQSISATVTQQGVGAVASGTARMECAGPEGNFALDAVVRGPTAFKSNVPVQVCIAAQIGVPSFATDSRQWCQDVRLLPENVTLVP